MKFDILHSFYKRWRTRPQDSPVAVPPKSPDLTPDGGKARFRSETDTKAPEYLPQDNRAVSMTSHEDGNLMDGLAEVSDDTGIAKRRKGIIDGIEYHPDIFSSLRELCRKYGLAELTLATDDGLIVATSADRDVEFDAVHYSQVVQLMATPSEPDVSLFQIRHKGSHLIGIIRSDRHINPIMREEIRDDTKVILQWWL